MGDGQVDRGHDRLIVRSRRPADVPSLCEVLAAQQPESRYPLTWPLPFPVEQFIVRDVEDQAWVAEVGGRPVGHVATARIVDHDDGIASGWTEAAGAGPDALACVSVLFVDRDLQGRGIGSALLDAAVAWCRRVERVPVLDVAQPDGDAAGFYRRRGWITVGEARPAWLPGTEPPVLLMLLPPDGPDPQRGHARLKDPS